MKATRVREAVLAALTMFIAYANARFAKVTPWVIFFSLAAAMLFDPKRDTLGVASAAFAVSLGLSAVTFSYARTVEGPAVRDELVFGGERLIGAAVMFLFASILRHAADDLPRYLEAVQATVGSGTFAEFEQSLRWLMKVLLALMAFVFFLRQAWCSLTWGSPWL